LTAPSSAMPVAPPTGATSSTAGMTPSGPYDPNSYKPSAAATTSVSQASTTPDRYQATNDRYGITPIGADPVTTEELPRSAENAPIAPPASSSPAGDRYGFANPSTTAPPPNMAGSPSQYDPTVMASPTPPAPAASAAPATVASLTAPAASPMATATVQTTAAGQYRPAGTSSYIGSIPARAVEVATRPEAPASTAPLTSPTTSTVPWTPAGTTTVPTTGPSQRY
jgi:hypothetical protein